MTNNKLVKIRGDSELPVEFELHKLWQQGKLKSKLIEFTGNHAVRVYWSDMYDGEPITKLTDSEGKN